MTLVISSTLPGSVKKKVPTRLERGSAPPTPPVPLPGFAHSTVAAKRPPRRQRVLRSARQAPAAALPAVRVALRDAPQPPADDVESVLIDAAAVAGRVGVGLDGAGRDLGDGDGELQVGELAVED